MREPAHVAVRLEPLAGDPGDAEAVERAVAVVGGDQHLEQVAQVQDRRQQPGAVQPPLEHPAPEPGEDPLPGQELAAGGRVGKDVADDARLGQRRLQPVEEGGLAGQELVAGDRADAGEEDDEASGRRCAGVGRGAAGAGSGSGSGPSQPAHQPSNSIGASASDRTRAKPPTSSDVKDDGGHRSPSLRSSTARASAPERVDEVARIERQRPAGGGVAAAPSTT